MLHRCVRRPAAAARRPRQSYAVAANLSGADLTNAVVDRVDFSNATLRGVKFINAVVTGAA